MRGKRREWRAQAVGLGLVLGLGCASSFVEDYQSRNPGWKPDLPRFGMGLEEVLASLHYESSIQTIDVEISHIEVIRTDEDPWTSVDFEEIESGREPLEEARDSAVLIEQRCTHTPGIAAETVSRWGTYLLPGGRLEAWDHASFREGCGVAAQFLPARAPLAPIEDRVIGMLRARGGRVSMGLREAYIRGFAYVEAGRSEDARAMLVIGEQLRRRLVPEVREGRMSAEILLETKEPREKLMRVLGLEAVPLGKPATGG